VETNNEINISINVSDDLLKKVMGMMVTLSQPAPMGIPAAMLGALAGPPPSKTEQSQKPTIGFKPNSSHKETK
jgi:hypothetical protein